MLTSYWKKIYTGVCNDIQHMFVTVPEVNLCLTIFCVSCNCFSFFFLDFNWCNAILTDKLTRAKEEGLSIKQMLDHTLMEMVNLWPSSVPLLTLPHLLWIWLAPIWLWLLHAKLELVFVSSDRGILKTQALRKLEAHLQFPLCTVVKGHLKFTVHL